MFPEIFQLQKRSFFKKRYALLILFYCWQILPIVFFNDVDEIYIAQGTTRFMAELPMLLSMVFVTLLAPLANAIVNHILAKFNWDGVTATSWRLLKHQFRILLNNVTVIDSEANRKLDCNKENWQTVFLQFILFAGALILFVGWFALIVSFYLFIGWVIVSVFEIIRLLKDSEMFNEV